jgi:hypothetical protein
MQKSSIMAVGDDSVCKKLRRSFSSSAGGYRAALAVDQVYRIVARSDGVAATAASHAPQSKIVKGYLAFIHCSACSSGNLSTTSSPRIIR